MPRTGGRTPYDKLNALTGPARVLWAETSVAVPAAPKDVVQQIANAQGEYPAKTGWNDFGLAADAPSYSHDKDTEGLEYQQPAGALFEQVTDIARAFTAQVAEIEPENMKIVENSQITAAVAASAAAAPDADKTAAWTLLHTGQYAAFRQYRIAMISYRPTGAGEVIEPGGTKRPPAVMRVLPLVTLAAEGTDMDFDRGEPVNAEVQFVVFPDAALGAGKEHGFWAFETAGTIAA